MSDKRFRPKVCGRCARVSPADVERNFCPVTSARIRHNKPAESCRFFVEDEDCVGDGRRRRRDEDVFDE